MQPTQSTTPGAPKKPGKHLAISQATLSGLQVQHTRVQHAIEAAS